MKKILFIIGFTALALLLGVFFSNRRSNQAPSTSPTSFQKAPGLSAPGISSQQPSYQLTGTFSFPTTLPAYQADPTTNTEELVSTLTKLFGFSSSPTQIIGSKGQYYLWKESGKTLTVGGNPLEVSYATQGSSKKFSAEANPKQTATAFLSKLSSLFNPLQLSQSSETLLYTSDTDPVVVTSKEDASVDLVGFSFLLENNVVLSRSSSLEGVEIGVDADGTVISCRFYVFPSFIKQESPYALITYAEAVNKLSTNSGVLLSLGFVGNKGLQENVIIQPDIPPSTSTISDVKLGYYFDPSSSRLVPSFFFFGQGKDKDGNILSTMTAVAAGK